MRFASRKSTSRLSAFGRGVGYIELVPSFVDQRLGQKFGLPLQRFHCVGRDASHGLGKEPHNIHTCGAGARAVESAGDRLLKQFLGVERSAAAIRIGDFAETDPSRCG
jgi:hypothetical protein